MSMYSQGYPSQPSYVYVKSRDCVLASDLVKALLSSNFQSRTRRARGEARRSPDCAMPGQATFFRYIRAW